MQRMGMETTLALVLAAWVPLGWLLLTLSRRYGAPACPHGAEAERPCADCQEAEAW